MNGSLDFDAVLDLCRDRHRRIALATLDEERRRLTVNDLTRTVVKYNHHAHDVEVPKRAHERIRSSLHHVHLPRLASAGIVEYDPERHLVEPTGQFDRLQPFLSAILDADPDLEPPVKL